MSSNDILENYQLVQQSLSPIVIIVIMLVALMGSLAIFLVYKITSKENLYNQSFAKGNVLLTLITAVMMIMISSNIVISLGMVGALSIVRFRTAVKDVRDTVYVFWSVVLGLSVGSQNYLLGLISTCFIGVIAVLLSMYTSNRKYILILHSDNKSIDGIKDTVSIYTKQTKLQSYSTTEGVSEIIFEFSMKTKDVSILLEKLKEDKSLTYINIVDNI